MGLIFAFFSLCKLLFVGIVSLVKYADIRLSHLTSNTPFSANPRPADGDLPTRMCGDRFVITYRDISTAVFVLFLIRQHTPVVIHTKPLL